MELFVRVYLNKLWWTRSTWDLMIASTYKSLAADTKAWLHTVTDHALRPLWGTIWHTSFRSRDNRVKESKRLAELDHGTHESNKQEVADAFILTMTSMTEGLELLDPLWRSIESRHAKRAMKHLWNALLGAVGLPNDSYVDRLQEHPADKGAPKRGEASTTKGERAGKSG
eukprot:313179-Amphidinium_carterae.1